MAHIHNFWHGKMMVDQGNSLCHRQIYNPEVVGALCDDHKKTIIENKLFMKALEPEALKAFEKE